MCMEIENVGHFRKKIGRVGSNNNFLISLSNLCTSILRVVRVVNRGVKGFEI